MSSEIKNSLFDAVRRNCITSVKELVHCYGLSYCPEWCGGYELLCIAIDKGHWNLAKFLLGEGARANNSEAVQKLTPLHLAVRKRKLTPLHLAVRKRWNQSLAEMLLEKNANIEAVNRKNQTPLHIAVLQGNYEAVHLLLKKGANVNARDKFKNDPLFIVAEKLRWNGHDKDIFVKAFGRDVPNESIYLEIMGILISYGAEVNFVNAKGETLLHLAVKASSLKNIEILIKHGANVNAATKMMSVSSYDYDEGFEIFDDFSFNDTKYSILNDHGLTPLHYAAKQNMVIEDIVIALLKHGADINARSKRNRTPLHYLIIGRQGFIGNMVALFLVHGAEPDAICSDGMTPLLQAAEYGHYENAATFLQFDVDVDNSGSIGQTPLHLALDFNCPSTVEIILNHGADINLKTRSGESAIALAISSCINSVDDTLYFNNDRRDFIYEYSALLKFRCHCIKLKTAGLHPSTEVWSEIPLDNFIHFQEESYLKSFEPDCKKEFQEMQKQKLCCHMTLSDILKSKKIHLLLRSKTFSQTLNSFDLGQFPIYGDLLKCIIQKGKNRNELLVSGYSCLDSLIQTSDQLNGTKLPILPIELKEIIISFLSNGDLRSLIRSVKGEFKSLEANHDLFRINEVSLNQET